MLIKPNQADFRGMPGIQRYLTADVTITEKVDGTNAVVMVTLNGDVAAGSKSRWLTPENDNFGFAAYVQDNLDRFLELGVGMHYGEWMGNKIQRGYGMDSREFVSFSWWREHSEHSFKTVPVLYSGVWDELTALCHLRELKECGSKLVSGFMNPEGIVIEFPKKANGARFKMFCEDLD
jgi:hypothetical protein